MQRTRAIRAYFDERFESESVEPATEDALAAFNAIGKPTASDGELLRTVRSTAAEYGVRGVRHPGWRDTVKATRTEACVATPGLLAARANQELDADRRRAFDKHLGSCRICHAAGLAAERAERAFATVIGGGIALQPPSRKVAGASVAKAAAVGGAATSANAAKFPASFTAGGAAPRPAAARIEKPATLPAAAAVGGALAAATSSNAAKFPASFTAGGAAPRPAAAGIGEAAMTRSAARVAAPAAAGIDEAAITRSAARVAPTAPAGRVRGWTPAASIGSRGRRWLIAAAALGAAIVLAAVLLLTGSAGKAPQPAVRASTSRPAPAHFSSSVKHTGANAKRTPAHRAAKPAKKPARPATKPASSAAASAPVVSAPPATRAPAYRAPAAPTPAPSYTPPRYSPPPTSYTPPPTQAPPPSSPPPSNPQPQGPVVIQQQPGLGQQQAPTQGIGSGH